MFSIAANTFVPGKVESHTVSTVVKAIHSSLRSRIHLEETKHSRNPQRCLCFGTQRSQPDVAVASHHLFQAREQHVESYIV